MLTTSQTHVESKIVSSYYEQINLVQLQYSSKILISVCNNIGQLITVNNVSMVDSFTLYNTSLYQEFRIIDIVIHPIDEFTSNYSHPLIGFIHTNKYNLLNTTSNNRIACFPSSIQCYSKCCFKFMLDITFIIEIDRSSLTYACNVKELELCSVLHTSATYNKSDSSFIQHNHTLCYKLPLVTYKYLQSNLETITQTDCMDNCTIDGCGYALVAYNYTFYNPSLIPSSVNIQLQEANLYSIIQSNLNTCIALTDDIFKCDINGLQQVTLLLHLCITRQNIDTSFLLTTRTTITDLCVFKSNEIISTISIPRLLPKIKLTIVPSSVDFYNCAYSTLCKSITIILNIDTGCINNVILETLTTNLPKTLEVISYPIEFSLYTSTRNRILFISSNFLLHGTYNFTFNLCLNISLCNNAIDRLLDLNINATLYESASMSVIATKLVTDYLLLSCPKKVTQCTASTSSFTVRPNSLLFFTDNVLNNPNLYQGSLCSLYLTSNSSIPIVQWLYTISPSDTERFLRFYINSTTERYLITESRFYFITCIGQFNPLLPNPTINPLTLVTGPGMSGKIFWIC